MSDPAGGVISERPEVRERLRVAGWAVKGELRQASRMTRLQAAPPEFISATACSALKRRVSAMRRRAVASAPSGWKPDLMGTR